MKLFVCFKYFIVFIMLSLCRVCPAQAQQNPDEVVLAFGKALSSWCKTNKIIYRKEITDLCSGIKSCRVEDKMHADYQRQRGLTNYETFVLDSYMNMFQSLMSKSVNYQMSNVKVVGSDEMPEGTLTFITADITVSGALNHTVTDLFLVRNNKITGIYSYSSNLGFSHLNGSLIRALNQGRYIWSDGIHNGYIKVQNEYGNIGLINVKGEVIIPCIWDAISYYGDDFATGYNYKDNRDKARITYDLRYDGKRTPLYSVSTFITGRDKRVYTFSEGYAVVSNEEGLKGYLSSSDNLYSNIMYLYESATDFCDGYAYVRQNGIAKIINKQFKEVLRSTDKYQICSRPYEGLIKVMDITNRKYGFIDISGKMVIPCIYCYTYDFNNGLCVVALGDSLTDAKFGCIDPRGNAIIPIIYDGCWGDFEDGYIEVFKDGKGTLLGINNKPLPGFSWEYDEVRRLCDGYARFTKGSIIEGKSGFLDACGRIVISPIYDFATFFVEGIACVSIHDKYGKHKYGGIDKNGILVIPCIYDSIFYFNNGIALVEKDDQVGLIDKYGNGTFMQKEQ